MHAALAAAQAFADAGGPIYRVCQQPA